MGCVASHGIGYVNGCSQKALLKQTTLTKKGISGIKNGIEPLINSARRLRSSETL
jgi:hypothetical protein